VEHFVECSCRRMDRQIEYIPPETMSALSQFGWRRSKTLDTLSNHENAIR
jgi:hypothetical protein